MKLAALSATTLCLLSSTMTLAAPRAFRIVSTKQLTPNVERFYGADDIAFATVFCNPKESQAMFVDSRYPELDGKVFLFGSEEACEKARKTARDMNRKCLTQLLLDMDTKGAAVQTSKCSTNATLN